MRNPTQSLTTRVVALLNDQQEMKTRQFVGTSQIKNKQNKSDKKSDVTFTLDKNFQSEGSGIATFVIEVTPQNLASGNIAITNLTTTTTDANYNLWDNDYQSGRIKFVKRINLRDTTKDTYFVAIVGNKGETVNMKIYIDANCDTTYTIRRTA